MPADDATLKAKYISYYNMKYDDADPVLDKDAGTESDVVGSPTPREIDAAPILLV